MTKKTDKIYRVYKTTLIDDDRFYIGVSGKVGKQWDKYFGSSTTIKNYKGEMKKEVLGIYTKKSHAKYKELLEQIKYMHDPMCLNGIINVRIRREWLLDYEE